MAEITVSGKYEMPIKIIVESNNKSGKITKEQRAGGWDKWATDLMNPDFAAYAESCGGLRVSISDKKELTLAMNQLLKHQGPGLLEIKADVKLI